MDNANEHTSEASGVTDWCIQAKLTVAHANFLIANGIQNVPIDLIDAFFNKNGDLDKHAIGDFVNQNSDLWKFLHLQLFTKALQEIISDRQQQQQNVQKHSEPPAASPKPESHPPKEHQEHFARSVAEATAYEWACFLQEKCDFSQQVAQNYANILMEAAIPPEYISKIELSSESKQLLKDIGISSMNDRTKIAKAIWEAVRENEVLTKSNQRKSGPAKIASETSETVVAAQSTDQHQSATYTNSPDVFSMKKMEEQISVAPLIIELNCVKVTPKSVVLQYSGDLSEMKSFEAFYATDGQDNEWRTAHATFLDDLFTIENLKPKTQYRFKIRFCTRSNHQIDSKPSDRILTDITVAMRLLSDAKPLQPGHPSIYRLPSRQVYIDDRNMMRIMEIGTPISAGIPNKVVMVIGETGSGKSTLINAIANFVLGVEWSDDFRFKLVEDINERRDANQQSQAHSQTKYITAYMFHWTESFPMPFSLTIIDTPGYGDTEGISRDEYLTMQIKHFFESNNIHSIVHIDAIGFVIASSQSRLTPVQKYVFDRVLGLFAREIGENIFLMITFCDANQPAVLASIQEFQVPYKDFFKFNNSALYADKNEANDEFNQMFWKLGNKSFQKFFDEIPKLQSKSLTLTKQVLRQRTHLELQLQGLNEQIHHGLLLLEQVEKEIKVIEQFETEINANSNFQTRVKVPKVRQKSIAGSGQYVTNCMICNFTCHYPCEFTDDMKYKCHAMHMDWSKLEVTILNTSKQKVDGATKTFNVVSYEDYEKCKEHLTCGVCPKKCHWKHHVNNDFRYETYEEEETRTLNDLKKKYESAIQGKTKAEAMKDSAEEKYQKFQAGVYKIIDEARKCIQELHKIALRPTALTTVDYIDLMIDAEKRQAKPGFRERINHLEKAKEKAAYIKKIHLDKRFDPLQELRNQRPSSRSTLKTLSDKSEGGGIQLLHQNEQTKTSWWWSFK